MLKRLCPYPCPRTIKGTLLRPARADKRYCSPTCRRRAAEARLKADADRLEQKRQYNRDYQARLRKAAKKGTNHGIPNL